MRTHITAVCCALLLATLAACESRSDPAGLANVAPALAQSDQYGATALENRILQYQAEGVLNDGLANSLLVKAHAAFLATEAGDLAAAERRLAALRAQVASLLEEGVLTEEQATALLGAAVDLRPLKVLLPGTWAFEDVDFCFEWQATHGTMTIDWLDREAGTFGGDMTFWVVYSGLDGFYMTSPVRNGHMEDDGAISFTAPFQCQFSDPQTGTFDGQTIRTTWTANCGPSSDWGGPVTHSVVFTRAQP